MQTQVMEKRVVGVPWLEHDRDGLEPEQHPLHSFPFSIGRVESADLQIDDARVSREHAVILREGKTYRIRDLHSTNGTMLNGQRVQDAEMTDGDILVIADVEFTFFTERSVSSYSMATEVMGAGGTVVESEQTRAAVRALRRLQQSLTQRAVDMQFQPVVDLASRRVFGHEAERSTAGEQLCEQLVLAAASRVAGRLFQLSRLVAVEEALRYGLGGNLFLPVESGEIGSDGLLESLARLARATPAGHRLVVAIQESSACDIPYFQSLCIRLRELGVGIAYHGFAGTRAHVAEKQGISPDFLMLDPKLTSDIHREAERQRQVQAIARACHDIGCATIASGLATEDAVRACRELGCQYGLGNVFGRPARAAALAQKPLDHPLDAPSNR